MATRGKPSIETYTVEPGDTCESIAEKSGVTWLEIFDANADIIGTNPNVLPIGEELIVPTTSSPSEPVVENEDE